MRNYTKTFVTLLLFLMIVFPIAIHAKELKKGMPFLAARKLLIHKGWQPLNIHKGKNFEYMGTDKKLVKAHIMEVEVCAVDRPSCIFNYTKGDKCLRLFTLGEEIKNMRVASWTYDCPDLQEQ